VRFFARVQRRWNFDFGKGQREKPLELLDRFYFGGIFPFFLFGRQHFFSVFVLVLSYLAVPASYQYQYRCSAVGVF